MRLGTGGQPFFIGTDSEFTAKANGQLYLAMNDLSPALWDNEGAMKADTKVRYPKPPAAAFAKPAN